MSEIYPPPRMLARHHQDEGLHFLNRESRTKATHLPRLHQGWGVDPMYGAVLMYFFQGKMYSALFGLVSYSRCWFLFLYSPLFGGNDQIGLIFFGWVVQPPISMLGGSSQLVNG